MQDSTETRYVVRPFNETSEQMEAVRSWRRFLEDRIRPATKGAGEGLWSKSFLLKMLKEVSAFGVGNGWISEDKGGAGLDFYTSGLFYEELSVVCPDLAMICISQEGAAFKLQATGPSAMSERYVPKLLASEMVGCSGISEPGAGSNVKQLQTKIVRTAKGYRISGSKVWISNSSYADIFLILAKDPDGAFSNVLVERERPGVSVREIPKLGFDAASLGQVDLVDVEVPLENLVGAEGSGLRQIMKGFERARAFAAIVGIGIARASLDASISYVRQREQFGSPIGSFQLVQQTVATMATDIEASRLLTYRTLQQMDKGVRCDYEAAMAKAFATEAAVRVASNAIQLHGAAGLTREVGVERHLRDARMLTIPDGTTHINQLLIARQIVGIDAFWSKPSKAGQDA